MGNMRVKVFAALSVTALMADINKWLSDENKKGVDDENVEDVSQNITHTYNPDSKIYTSLVTYWADSKSF